MLLDFNKKYETEFSQSYTKYVNTTFAKHQTHKTQLILQKSNALLHSNWAHLKQEKDGTILQNLKIKGYHLGTMKVIIMETKITE